MVTGPTAVYKHRSITLLDMRQNPEHNPMDLLQKFKAARDVLADVAGEDHPEVTAALSSWAAFNTAAESGTTVSDVVAQVGCD